ncbi:glycosyltransferase family 61 protein [Pseudoprimorskyibacter insulae]|uniref:Glycosyltransferase 61 catalytic domain-containing protein n=1 Tax=Pseudoprimorskyibacter insulae TaxID=1695997 RepID=A0A2R8AWV4_9RHOB|nr:glycosyltransferase 61 family protein [Pseudoprimorskyibacter insulae]SPF80513.1 hypothetical protein PRI8871_02323 [Pseudoprimorskyibacter insulae]
MTHSQTLEEQAVGPEISDLAQRLAAGGAVQGQGWQMIEPRGEKNGIRIGDVAVVLLRDAYYFPRSGLILDAEGRALASPLEVVRGGAAAAEKARSQLGRAVPMGRASVFAGGGGRRNYGHFLLDDLAGAAWLETLGIARHYPLIAPPLTGWQRALMGAAGVRATEVSEPVLRVAELVYTTAIGHYLQRADKMQRDLVDRLPRGAAPGAGAVYLSRRGMTGRVMVNEPALEARLKAQGVTILKPHKMTVAEQIEAVSSARVLIGASGAALANAVFLPKGGTVIEIRPATVREFWIFLMTDNLSLTHHLIDVGGALKGRDVPLRTRLMQLPRQLARRYRVAYRCDLEAVERAVSAAL